MLEEFRPANENHNKKHSHNTKTTNNNHNGNHTYTEHLANLNSTNITNHVNLQDEVKEMTRARFSKSEEFTSN